MTDSGASRPSLDREPGGWAEFDIAWEKQAKVSLKVHLPQDILELLRDVSLARAISDLAAAVKVSGKGNSFRQPSISRVIAQMVEERRTFLEQEVAIVRGNTRRKKIATQTADVIKDADNGKG